MILFPNAKINLGLRIVRKRADGFHDLETIFYPVPWKDSLEIMEAGTYSFEQYGFWLDLDEKPNIVESAYRLLCEQFDLPPVQMALLKNIPAGAGLGGGSADAAFALKALNDQFQLGLDPPQLKNLAAQLGSDCPFFLENQPAKAAGKGDRLQPVKPFLEGYHIVVAYPDNHVSTSWAYGQIRPTGKAIEGNKVMDSQPDQWQNMLINDFEKPVMAAHPEIGKVKERLYDMGALFATMSGSGSAVYGIFKEAPGQIHAARALQLPHEHVFSGIL